MSLTIPPNTTTIHVKNSPDAEMVTKFGTPESTFEMKVEPLRELKQGELLVRNLYLSNDPTQRVWIAKDIPEEALYVEPIRAGDPMKAYAVVQVLKSNDPKFKQGDLLSSLTYWGDNVIIPSSYSNAKIYKFLGYPLSAYVDIVGGTGLTAYFSMFEVHKLKKSDVLVVSGAAGATGSMVVQLAKKVIGARKVIGIAGGEAKCNFVKSLGADECVDYRSKDFAGDMKKALGEDKECDVFFDGVGGEILEQMMLLTKKHGTIIACGSVSGYNDQDKLAIRTWGLITTRRLNVKGFIVIDYLHKAMSAVLWLTWWLKRGYIKYDPSNLEIDDLSDDKNSLEKLPVVLNKLFNGQKKNGKLVTKLADPQ